MEYEYGRRGRGSKKEGVSEVDCSLFAFVYTLGPTEKRDDKTMDPSEAGLHLDGRSHVGCYRSLRMKVQ